MNLFYKIYSHILFLSKTYRKYRFNILMYLLQQPSSCFDHIEDHADYSSSTFSSSQFPSFSSSSSATISRSSSLLPDSSTKTNISLFDFKSEWQNLCDTYCGIQGNEGGLMHARAGNFVSALQCWKKTAGDTGYAKANYNMGVCYETGKGTKKDLAKVRLHF